MAINLLTYFLGDPISYMKMEAYFLIFSDQSPQMYFLFDFKDTDESFWALLWCTFLSKTNVSIYFFTESFP